MDGQNILSAETINCPICEGDMITSVQSHPDSVEFMSLMRCSVCGYEDFNY